METVESLTVISSAPFGEPLHLAPSAEPRFVKPPKCVECGSEADERLGFEGQWLQLDDEPYCRVCFNSASCRSCRGAKCIAGKELCEGCDEDEDEALFDVAAQDARAVFAVTPGPTEAHREASGIIAAASVEAAKAGKVEVAELLLRAAKRVKDAA